MQKALADARIDPKDVDYINAHGTSTHLNDLNESTAIKALLGQHAYEIPRKLHKIHDRASAWRSGCDRSRWYAC